MGYNIFDFGFQSRMALLDILCETCTYYNVCCECEHCIVEKIETFDGTVKRVERELDEKEV